MFKIQNSKHSSFSGDPIERGMRIFGVFGKIETLIIDGITVPDYLIDIRLGKIAKGIIKICAFSIARINRKCVLRVTTERNRRRINQWSG